LIRESGFSVCSALILGGIDLRRRDLRFKTRNMRNVKEKEYGGEGGILPPVQQEIPVMMVKPNLRVCNGTEVL